MKLYRDLLKLTKDVIAEIELPFKVKKEQKNLEMKILELEQTMAKDELLIQEEKSKCPINWDNLCEAIDREALNSRKLRQLQKLQTELFG